MTFEEVTVFEVETLEVEVDAYETWFVVVLFDGLLFEELSKLGKIEVPSEESPSE